MEFLFLDKYVMRFNEEERLFVSEKLETMFSESVSGRGVVTADHIAGDVEVDDEWRDAMYLDNWILSIYPPEGQSMVFIKCMGESEVMVRAINEHTNAYETMTLDVVEAVEILMELEKFVRRSPPPSPAIENGF